MRRSPWTLAAVAAALAAVPAQAQTYSGSPLSPPALQADIVTAVASRLLNPPMAHLRDLKLSKARGGSGYCGFVSVDGVAPYQPFHIIITDDGKPAVLILPVSGNPPGLSRDDATLLLGNFGCLP